MMVDNVSPVTSFDRTQHFGPKKAEKEDVRNDRSDEASATAESKTEDDVKAASFAVGGLSVRFEMDKEIDRVVVTVTDKESGEVIREIPSEEARELAKHLVESSGKMLDRIV